MRWLERRRPPLRRLLARRAWPAPPRVLFPPSPPASPSVGTYWTVERMRFRTLKHTKHKVLSYPTLICLISPLICIWLSHSTALKANRRHSSRKGIRLLFVVVPPKVHLKCLPNPVLLYQIRRNKKEVPTTATEISALILQIYYLHT